MIDMLEYGAFPFLEEAKLYPNQKLARIISQYKNLYKIITEDGEREAEISGKLRYGSACLSDYPAVGDFVAADYSADNGGSRSENAPVKTPVSLLARISSGSMQCRICSSGR